MRSTAHEVHDQAGYEQNQEDEEQDLGDAGGRRCDAAETDQGCDQRHDKKDQSLIKQRVSPK